MFGWTPSQIGWLSLQELNHYTEQANKQYSGSIWPLEETMSAIRQVLFGWLGVKEPKRFKATDNIDISKLGLPVMKVTSKAVDAWEAAGRPEPKKFFAEYKNDA